MLVLVWSREEHVRNAVVDAYRNLYITSLPPSSTGKPSERAKAQYIVNNLTALITGATLGELASLEEVFYFIYLSIFSIY